MECKGAIAIMAYELEEKDYQVWLVAGFSVESPAGPMFFEMGSIPFESGQQERDEVIGFWRETARLSGLPFEIDESVYKNGHQISMDTGVRLWQTTPAL